MASVVEVVSRPKTVFRLSSAWTARLVVVARHLGFALAVLLTIIYLSFFGLEMARGAPFAGAVSFGVRATLHYMGQLAAGDLGVTSSASKGLRELPVSQVLWPIVNRSLGLLLASLLVTIGIGLPAGILAARWRRSGFSLVILLLTLAGISLPSFFTALLLQIAMIKWARATNGPPLFPVGGFGWDAHLVLPAVVLAARPIAQLARITFLTLDQVLGQDFIRTARSKGLREGIIWQRHILRNAAISVLTTLGSSLRFSLSSLPVVEFFFGWPGIGFNLLRSISRQDDQLTVALVLCLGLLFIATNWLLEALFVRIDPRLRERKTTQPYHRRAAGSALWDTIRDLFLILSELPPVQWLIARKRGDAKAVNDERQAAFWEVLRNQAAIGQTYQAMAADYVAERRRAWLRATAGNSPFVLGSILVVALIFFTALGPRLSPHNPYAQQGLTFINGKMVVPPFPPSKTYPWGTDVLGRDIMSLVLSGAQRTLGVAALVILARLLVGVTLGAIAGWAAGSLMDRVIVGLSEVIAAFPALLLAMVLILALGIRAGTRPFIIALCFVGWGEVMQFVRSQVMALRPKLFIEAATAVGLRTPQIVWRHILPNLLAALISISALEMGAVLMLLGELGFIGIFLGGGAFAELDVAAAPYHYSDVPEWGALLSNVRYGARSYPWTAVYPAVAFALSILAFNLFGEGLRRLMEEVGIGFTRVVNRTTVIAALFLLLTIGWIHNNFGPITFYREQARGFDGLQALVHAVRLSHETMGGRAAGTKHADRAAEYIAEQFGACGLQPAGEQLTYFQTRKHNFLLLDELPTLTLDDGGPAPVYRKDFAEYAGPYRNLGKASGRVRFIALGPITRLGGRSFRARYPALEALDVSDDILLVLNEEDALLLGHVKRQGILIVAPDQATLTQRKSLSTRDPTETLFGTNRRIGTEAPSLWISEKLANRLLQNTGQTVARLRALERDLNRDEAAQLPLDVHATFAIHGSIHEKVPVKHVIGHLPGLDTQLNDKLIMVLAQYDGLPPGPEDTFYPAANDNASGVAVMLEAVHNLQVQEYRPKRTFLFVAYAGEGVPYGRTPDAPFAPKDFLKAKQGFSTAFDIEAVIFLRGLGSGNEPPRLDLWSSGNERLVGLFERAARQIGVKTRRTEKPLDISVVFEEGSFRDSADEAPNIELSWQGWDRYSHQPSDTYDRLSPWRLQDAGRVLSLALMVMGGERRY